MWDFKENSTHLQGDCLDLLPGIESGIVKLVCADLPYGTTQCKWDSVIDLDRLWPEYKRIIQSNGVIALFAQTPFDKVLGVSNLEMLRYEWIWEKTSATGHLNSKKAPMKAHENILVFYNKQPAYNPQMTHGHKRKVSSAESKMNCENSKVYGEQKKMTAYDSTSRYPRSVQVFASDKQKLKLHETQKPEALLEYVISTYTNEFDLVLDNCFGSNTCGAACKTLKRKYIGMEKDPVIFQTGLDRVS